MQIEERKKNPKNSKVIEIIKAPGLGYHDCEYENLKNEETQLTAPKKSTPL